MGRKPKLHKPLPFSFDQVLNAVSDGLPTTTLLPAKPFVKWVGGKRSIVNELQERMPDQFDHYFEAFIGGGALYFATQPKNAYLSDANFQLVLTYRAIRDDLSRVLRNLKIHESKHEKEYFLKCRARLNTEVDYIKIAALFIYLNKTCFNGLYRVNKSGGFNVPMGSYTNPKILDRDNLLNVSQVLQGTEILQHSFEHTPIMSDSFYYLDPPYHETYSSYSSDGFGDEEHKKLAGFCHQINEAGSKFMLSNSNTDFIKTLYDGYNIETVSALRSVSCKANQRGRENECLIRNYE